MKITVSINLGGYSFNIDEDAYAELKSYLRNLEFHFAGENPMRRDLSALSTVHLPMRLRRRPGLKLWHWSRRYRRLHKQDSTISNLVLKRIFP